MKGAPAMGPDTAEPTYESSSLQIHQAVSSWFLGPQAENAQLLKDLFNEIVGDHVAARTSYHPEDGAFVTDDVKQSQVYRKMVEELRAKFTNLSALLNDFSVPFYSPRYAAHMTFESSLPSIVGWLSAMLLNPNNVSFEAGPITTLLELQVGQDLCKMLGFRDTEDIKGWGHLTCDGTVSNIEAIWSARNLKFYPLALKSAMEHGEPLNFIAETFTIAKCHGGDEPSLFRDLDTWDLLNLQPQHILEIPDRLTQEHGISAHFLETAMSKYIVQSTGMNALAEKWGVKESPKFLIASTRHYSWPKGVALAGVGSENLVSIPVDKHARIDIPALRHILDNCLNQRQAVYAVIATIGTSEEGAVDPLAKILSLREEYQARGLSFLIHADAAWGGYFTSTLRDPPAEWHSNWPINTEDGDQRAPFDKDYVPTVTLKQYTLHQLDSLQGADSVTIDPHKSGYCLNPAGGLCYRDRRMRHLLTWSAPYIEHGKRGESIGIHGVEGSKPGATAASVYMHHSVIGLHKRGHGGLLGEVSFTCARMAAHWATMSDITTPYIVTPFNSLRFEPHLDAVESEKEFIKQRILGRSNDEIAGDPDPGVMAELGSLGSDLNINAFVCNFRLKAENLGADPDEWVVNDDVAEANYFNRCIFDRLSTDIGKNPRTGSSGTPMFISSTIWRREGYGECLRGFKERAGLETESGLDLFVLRNVVMSPFQAGAGFAAKLAETFKEVLEDCLKHVVAKNTITSQIHRFIIQGTDRMYLAYRPLFHKANGKQQLILEVDIPDEAHWHAYLAARKAHPNATFTLSTTRALPITIDDLLSAPQIPCLIEAPHVVLNVKICNPRIVKNRSLISRWLDAEYDGTYTPFYLYGTPRQKHIDHMLLKAPNAQFTAENVDLQLDHDLPRRKLANGVLLYVMHRPERAMQPFGESGGGERDAGLLPTPGVFFYPDARYEVMICDDPFPATAHGPGLASASDHHPVIARGTMRLPLNVYSDVVDLNREDFRDDERITQRMSSGMNWEDKAAWRAVVMERLPEMRPSEYFSSRVSGDRVDGAFNDGRDISRRPEDLVLKEMEQVQDVMDAGYN